MTVYRLLLIICLIGVTNANAALLNAELVVNGGAERGNTTGWTTTGIEAVRTGSGYASGYGSWAFTGARGALTQTMSQTIDLSANSAMIDNGVIESLFSINLQSRSDAIAMDYARAELSFFDGSGSVLNTVSFVDNINTGSFDWNMFSDSSLLSKGTRSVEILLTATRGFGTGVSNDGFFDDISFKLNDISPRVLNDISPNPVPVPAAVWLFGSGMIVLLSLRKPSKLRA